MSSVCYPPFDASDACEQCGVHEWSRRVDGRGELARPGEGRELCECCIANS